MPLSWNEVDEESKGDDKRKGKKSGKRINRYVELDCNIEDTGIYSYTCVFPIERNKYSKIVRKKKEKKHIHIRWINGATGNGLSNSDRFPARRKI